MSFDDNLNTPPRMISMTGFGEHSQILTGDVSVRVAAKSLNSRFLEINIKGVKLAPSLESAMRKIISSFCTRGKVEVVIAVIRPVRTGGSDVSFLPAIADGLLKSVQTFLDARGISDAATNARLIEVVLARPEVWRRESVDAGVFEELGSCGAEGEEWQVVCESVRSAIAQLVSTRTAEGSRIGCDIIARFGRLSGIHQELVAIACDEAARIAEELRTRITSLLGEGMVFDERLAQEVALLADRADIQEELVRIRSHLDHVQKVIAEPPQGRALDFYLQELGREFSTVGAKARRPSASALVVEAKTELERIREQAANIE